MSEAEPIPPTSSVTALRIPMIKKGEYDLWSMKMRQYIAITDHILWDIITNGDQATTDPGLVGLQLLVKVRRISASRSLEEVPPKSRNDMPFEIRQSFH
ncbi:hypothetical protein Tco_1280536 [Tanacetum coccineum]